MLRDIIKDQIEQMGKVLQRLIGLALQLKDIPDTYIEMAEVEKSFTDQFNFQFKKIDELENDALELYFKEHKFSNSILELLITYYLERGLSKVNFDKKEEARLDFMRALKIETVLNKWSQTFSISRDQKIKHLKQQLAYED
jgi:hypothetical protein